MRIPALARRILHQLAHDKRTLGLMLVVPLILLTLIYFVFEGTVSELPIGVVNPSTALTDALKENDSIKLTAYTTWDDAVDALRAGDETAIINMAGFTPDEAAGDKWQLRILVDGTDGARAATAKTLLEKTLDSVSTATAQRRSLADNLSALLTNAGMPADKVSATLGKLTEGLGTAPATAAAGPISYTTDFLDGIAELRAFDQFGSTLMGFIIFFFVFLVAGMAFLKERRSGTLEKLLSTPIRRWEVAMGYLCGFGVITVVQSVVISLFIIKVLGVMMVGSIWYMLLISLLTAACALTLGMLLSSAAGSEFQMMQFIPIVIIPQIFFSGLFDLSRGWMLFGRIFPLTYIADALNAIMFRGAGIGEFYPDVLVLVGFSALFLGLNILLLKRYRKI